MAFRRGVVVVLGLIVAASIVSAVFLMLVVVLVGREPAVPANAALVQPISGEIEEMLPADLLELVRGVRPRTVREIVDNLRKAKADRRISGVIIAPANLSVPFWGKLQEIREAILEFRRSGKPAVAYLEDGFEREYFLATACDRIFLMPTSSLYLDGLASYELFLRGTLDKIGTYPDLLAVGAYKSAINVFTETGYTPAHREMSESINRDLYDQLVRAIAEGRRKTDAEVRALVDDGPFLPEEALQAGLVDELAYEDQIDDRIRIGTAGRRIDADRYDDVPLASVGLGRGPRIAVIQAVGLLNTGRSGWSPTDGWILGSDTLIQQIRRARADASIRAIVLRVDSPGGSATAADAVWRELAITRRGPSAKPIVASMSDLAASGGYYLAMAASDIVAQPATLTGSIGVYGGKFVTEGTFNKLGANIDGVSHGRMADMQSPSRPYAPEERAWISRQMQSYYDQWIDKVANARGMTRERVEQAAQGRVWTGGQARQIGLVDELGGLDRAVALAKIRARIPPDQEVELVAFPPRRSLYELLLERLSAGSLQAEAVGWLAWRDLAAATVPLRVFRRGELLALMPQVFLP